MKTKVISMFVILALFIVVIVSIIGLLYYFVYGPKVEEYASDLIALNNVETTKQLKSEIDEKFIIMRVQLNSTKSALNSFDHTNTVLLDAYFDDQEIDLLIESEYVLTDMDGIIYYTYPYNEQIIGHDISAKEYFVNAQTRDTIYVTKPYQSLGSNYSVITLALRCEDYYIITNVPMDYLDTIFQRLVVDEQSRQMMILDRYGIILFDSSSTNDDIRLPLSSFEEIRVLDNNVIFDFDYNNVLTKATKDTIEQTDWTIIFFQNRLILEEYQLFLQRSLLQFATLITLIFVVFVSVGTVLFSKTIHTFDDGLTMISEGHYGTTFQTSHIKVLNTLGNKLNITSQALLEYNDKLSRIAYYDGLTGVYNRESLKLKFREKFGNSTINVILVNIRRFSIFNESYGYDWGNKILNMVSSRLYNLVAEEDTFGRLENDKFVIYTSQNPNELLATIQEDFSIPILVDQIYVNINLCFYCIEHELIVSDFDSTIKQLQQMIFQESNNKRDVYYFKSEYNSIYQRQIDIELSLEESLVNREFQIVFQPVIIKNDKHQIRGFEALARWKHPSLGLVLPDEFIPLLESTNKIHRLDQFIISESIKMIKSLSKNSNKQFILACNASVQTILWDGFTDFIKTTIERFKFNPACLEIEITESTIIYDPVKVKQIINELTSYGVRFSQDDFGDGFSSLNYLTQLQLTTLKISKSIIDTLLDGYNNRLLVETVINLGHSLGFDIIAEGVEHEEVAQVLMDINCDFIQGYLYYKPLTIFELETLIKTLKN